MDMSKSKDIYPIPHLSPEQTEPPGKSDELLFSNDFHLGLDYVPCRVRCIEYQRNIVVSSWFNGWETRVCVKCLVHSSGEALNVTNLQHFPGNFFGFHHDCKHGRGWINNPGTQLAWVHYWEYGDCRPNPNVCRYGAAVPN